jgi:hypothetical protein
MFTLTYTHMYLSFFRLPSSFFFPSQVMGGRAGLSYLLNRLVRGRSGSGGNGGGSSSGGGAAGGGDEAALTENVLAEMDDEMLDAAMQ